MKSQMPVFQNNKPEIIAVSCLLLLTFIVCVIQYLGFERSFNIDLSNQTNISTRDDRLNGGTSIASYNATEDGIEFSCQVNEDHYKWPFCELKFNLSLITGDKVEGKDLSMYERVGLWIEHDHKEMPGTRVELHNFNSAYSENSINDSLKYNTLEFFENKVPTPTWINFHSFYVPTWWNASHDLANGGTDFTNIRTISITTPGEVNESLYRLTVKRIEFRGKYIENDTLFFILTIIWSCVTGFFIRQLSLSKNKVMSINEQKRKWQVAAFTDSLTGANNRDSARSIFDDLLAKSNVLSLLFIDIDFFKKVNDTFGHNVGDEILVEFSKVIMKTVDDTNVLVRWGGEEFLLLCPFYYLSEAKDVAEKIRKAIEKSTWVEGIKLTASIGVAEKGQCSIGELIEAADKALYQAKANGRNRVELSFNNKDVEQIKQRIQN
jgi:diguanylate cyclase (GGDEF)-like protein